MSCSHIDYPCYGCGPDIGSFSEEAEEMHASAAEHDGRDCDDDDGDDAELDARAMAEDHEGREDSFLDAAYEDRYEPMYGYDGDYECAPEFFGGE